MQRRNGKIALLHHVGTGNLGDDATLDTVIQNIKRRRPDAEIAAFTANPEDTRQRHRLPSYPILRKPWSWYKTSAPADAVVRRPARQNRFLYYFRRLGYTLAVRLPRAISSELSFLVTSQRKLSSFEVLVISGGGQLTEWGGPWAFLFTVYKWVLLAKSARVKCLFLNIGAGPLTHPLSKFFARRALSAADYVSFRDAQSQKLANQIGFKGVGQVYPDCVYIREVPAPMRIAGENGGQSIVGIAPMPYCDPRMDPAERNLAIYEGFIERLTTFASSLARESYLLRMFGTDIAVDQLAIEDLRMKLLRNHNIRTPEFESMSSLDEVFSRMSAVDYIVTCRFHGIVFAHLLNKPVLALSHHPKMNTLMNDLGLSKYCLDIRTCQPADLCDAFASLVAAAAEVKSRMASSLASYRSRLTGQFDNLFGS
jgi:polysaccharide pyruvyl transferase WcaK-like protein